VLTMLTALTAATLAGAPGLPTPADHHAVCGGCADHDQPTLPLFRRPTSERGSGVIYLNDDTGVVVSLGSSMPPEPFANRTTEASLASVAELDTPETIDPHTQSTHVWVSGADLELDLDLGDAFDLSTMHFWNYNGEGFDVDEIDMIFYDDALNEIGRIDDLTPALGSNAGGGIVAENISLEFPAGVRYINMWLRGSNNEVDFQNIGFTGSFSSGGQPVAIAAGPASALLPPEGGAVAFTVSARGAPPRAFQWRLDGEPIPGAISSKLTIDASLADVGLYDCVVSNDFGSATTAPAVLRLRPLGCNEADLAAPSGVLNFNDVIEFLTIFSAGCP